MYDRAASHCCVLVSYHTPRSGTYKTINTWFFVGFDGRSLGVASDFCESWPIPTSSCPYLRVDFVAFFRRPPKVQGSLPLDEPHRCGSVSPPQRERASEGEPSPVHPVQTCQRGACKRCLSVHPRCPFNCSQGHCETAVKTPKDAFRAAKPFEIGMGLGSRNSCKALIRFNLQSDRQKSGERRKQKRQGS